MSEILEAAKAYVDRFWTPVPLYWKAKEPVHAAWQTETVLDVDIEFGREDRNIGILLGPRSNHLCDIDLDNQMAVKLAPQFLPPTESIFGRNTKPNSHWLYHLQDHIRYKKYVDPTSGDCIAEIRFEGQQTMFPPSVHPNGENIVWYKDGDEAEAEPATLQTKVSELVAATLLTLHWPAQGSRHNAALHLAGGLIRVGWDEDKVKWFVEIISRAAGDNEIQDRLRTVETTFERWRSEEKITGWVHLTDCMDPRVVYEVRSLVGDDRWFDFSFDDIGNAARFVTRYQKDLRYVPEVKKWYAFDGMVWRASESYPTEVATEIARDLHDEARRAPTEALTKQAMAWAKQSGAVNRINAMIQLASRNKDMVTTQDEFDQDPWLLNVQNGTIDLRTGGIRPHNREDRLAKFSPVAYEPSARSIMWEEFLKQTTGGDVEFIAFLQRIIGYSLTGLTTEEKLFLIHGPGATGKSTFINALKVMLGNYADTANFESFIARNNSSGAGPRSDLAKLKGKRLVTSIEVDKGKRLAEALVKQITGGDTIAVRFLYGEEFEYVPTFKLFLVANDAPKVSDDNAIWRRIIRIPFDKVVPPEKRNHDIKGILTNITQSGPALLAWAVQGCLDWQRRGLDIPDVVRQATESYQSSMDTMGDFLADTVIRENGAKARTSEVYSRYVNWTRQVGDSYHMNRVDFRQWMESKGWEAYNVKGISYWRHLKMRESHPGFTMTNDIEEVRLGPTAAFPMDTGLPD